MPATILSFYIVIIYNLFPPIFGRSFILFLQGLFLFYGFFYIINAPVLKRILEIFKKRETIFLLIFVVFIFLSHLLSGSLQRHYIIEYTFTPIFQLIFICLAIQYAIIQNISFEIFLHHLRIVFWINIVLGGYYLIFTDISFHTNIEMVEGAGFNTNIFATRCIQLFLVELFFLRKMSIYKIPLLVIPVYLCLETGSRGGLIILVLVSLYWVFKLKNKSFILLIISFAAIIITTFNFDFIIERFLVLSDNYDESGTRNILRFQLFLRGVYIFLDNPIFGAGIGTFHQFRHTWIELIPISRSDSFMDSHNSYIQILSETGLVGMILFLAFLYFLIKAIVNYKGFNMKIYIFLMGNIILYLFSGLFNHDIYRYYLLMPLLVGSIYSKYEMSLNP